MSVALLVGLVAVPNADAGQFEVRSCQASSTRSVAAWVPGIQSAHVPGPFGWCGGGGGTVVNEMDMRESLALHGRYGSPGVLVSNGRWASVVLSAPSGARLVRARYQRRLKVYDPEWVPKLLAGTVVIDECRPDVGSESCPADNEPAVVKDESFTAFANDVESITLAVDCEDSSCLDATTASPLVMAALYSSIVTVEENVAPSVSAPEAVGAAAGWLGDGGKVRLVGADTLGLRKLELLHGGSVVGTVTGSCVDWSVTPCAEASAGASTSLAGDVEVGGLGLAAGPASLQVRATDAAGNTATSGTAVLHVDTAAPHVENLDASRDASLRRITWTYGERAPLASLVARTCVGPSPERATCTDQTLSPDARSTQVEVPDGQYGRVTVIATNVLGRQGSREIVVPFRTPAGGTPTPTPAPTGQPRAGKLALTLQRLPGRRLKVSGNATPGAASRVTVKLSAPRRGQPKWTRTLRLTPTKQTGRFARTVVIPAAVRVGARITVSAATTAAPGWKPATAKRTLRR